MLRLLPGWSSISWASPRHPETRNSGVWDMDVSETSGFSPQIIHFNRVFHCKPSILGYHHLRKHPYRYPKMIVIMAFFNFFSDMFFWGGWKFPETHFLQICIPSFFQLLLLFFSGEESSSWWGKWILFEFFVQLEMFHRKSIPCGWKKHPKIFQQIKALTLTWTRGYHLEDHPRTRK